MEVVIFGATGFVGSAVFRASVRDKAISRVIVVTRRELTSSLARHPKVTVILHQNFLEYPNSLLEQISGAAACIWCIGGRHSQTARWPTYEDYVRDNVDLPLAAAKAFIEYQPIKPREKPFRFIFCSGHATELNQGKTLWVMSKTRKVKGLAEKGLFSLADQHPKRFRAYSVRPCGIYQPKPSAKDWLMTKIVLPSLRVESLAATMVHVAKEGYKARVVDHETAKEMGEQLLEQQYQVIHERNHSLASSENRPN